MNSQLPLDMADDSDGLVIIGTPRDAPGTQSHSTFRKIDMSVKQGKLVSLTWGDLMVMLPRDLYTAIYDHATSPQHESRAAALADLLSQGLAVCSE